MIFDNWLSTLEPRWKQLYYETLNYRISNRDHWQIAAGIKMFFDSKYQRYK